MFRRRHTAVPLLAALAFAALLILVSTQHARAQEIQEVIFTFKDHKVIPDKLILPAGKKFKFIVKN